MAPTLENFLKGTPLTAEIAALMEDQEPEQQQPAPAQQRSDAGELTDDDREHLRRLQVDPGWAVALRLLDRSILTHEETVKRASIEDPLTNRDVIVNSWAYVSMLKRARNLLTNSVNAEVLKLDENERTRA